MPYTQIHFCTRQQHCSDSANEKVGSYPKFKLPDHIQTVLDLQVKSAEERGYGSQQELRKALGGILPKPQSGIPESKWTTAVVLTFLRRIPDLISIHQRILPYGLFSCSRRYVVEASS